MQNEHNFYMKIAYDVAQASYCVRSKVGAIIVKGGNIIAFGYNGTPAGFPNECEDDAITLPNVLHAESNALMKCARWGGNAEGAKLYMTMSPCFECAKLIIQAGIIFIYYMEIYRQRDGLYLLGEAGIPYKQIPL